MREFLSFPLVPGDFAVRCGDAHDDGTDRYRLWISKNTWDDFRNYEFTVHGDWLDASVRDDMTWPSTAPYVEGVTTIEVRSRLRLRDAEPIREAWDSALLWHAKQGLRGCSDGRVLFLQACVHGRYAARDRGCHTAASAQGQALWEAVTALLPAPRRTGERMP